MATKDGRKTGGRVKGTPNVMTTKLQNAIFNTFEKAGGEEYLAKVAEQDPRTFIMLLGKLLPKEVKADIGSGSIEEMMARIDGSTKTLHGGKQS